MGESRGACSDFSVGNDVGAGATVASLVTSSKRASETDWVSSEVSTEGALGFTIAASEAASGTGRDAAGVGRRIKLGICNRRLGLAVSVDFGVFAAACSFAF
jgi:hypothetical protein